MIQIVDLIVKIKGAVILNNIQATFEESLVHGIVGLNGAGKTTFFNTLSCVLKPSFGRIIFKDRPISFKDIGYLESSNFFYSNITGREYINIFEQTNPDFNILALSQLTNLPLDNLIETYSSGMKKKLAMLAILKQNKPIFLFDEPFNSLDIESSKILELVIANLKDKQKTLFISSHIIETLVPICDYIHLIEKGTIKKTFCKNEFNSIEDELLGHFKQSARSIINESI
ncbi:MAG: ATP-binding cassette domain-containing protein [Bacteroidetes bacterium]|nr:ATP-binding cassette domain-containing protein [Bacteroidota bacterium]